MQKRVSFLLFLDLKKAFDFVFHSILLKKLYPMDFEVLRLIYYNRALQTVYLNVCEQAPHSLLLSH